MHQKPQGRLNDEAKANEKKKKTSWILDIHQVANCVCARASENDESKIKKK
jgi:hypothetical protein